jgi:hypothetical protein
LSSHRFRGECGDDDEDDDEDDNEDDNARAKSAAILLLLPLPLFRVVTKTELGWLDAALALVARRPSWMMAKRRRWRIIEPTHERDI